MFNVYPVQIRYVRMKNTGLLAGIPLNCTFGVASVADAHKVIDDLKLNAGNDRLYGFEIDTK